MANKLSGYRPQGLILLHNVPDLLQQIENLLTETVESHHQAFIATEGEDSEWPLWYAEHLMEKRRSLLNAKFTKSELIYMLVSAEKEIGCEAPGAE
jgi:hypothetical protein